MARFCNAIQKAGIPVSVTHGDTVKNGIAVIYPVRTDKRVSGNISYTSEGYADNGKFMFFSETSLLENAQYGDIVSDGEHQYSILWIDTYSCRFGSYAKAGLKIFTNGSVVS